MILSKQIIQIIIYHTKQLRSTFVEIGTPWLSHYRFIQNRILE